MRTTRPLILIVAPEQGSHVSPVVAVLQRQNAAVVRMDQADLPRTIGIEASLTSLAHPLDETPLVSKK